jgi:hypothetical protein
VAADGPRQTDPPSLKMQPGLEKGGATEDSFPIGTQACAVPDKRATNATRMFSILETLAVPVQCLHVR